MQTKLDEQVVEALFLKLAYTIDQIKKLIDDVSDQVVLYDNLMIPVEDLDLGLRPYNALKRQGMNNMADIMIYLGPDRSLWYNRLVSLRWVGHKSADRILDVLHRYLKTVEEGREWKKGPQAG